MLTSGQLCSKFDTERGYPFRFYVCFAYQTLDGKTYALGGLELKSSNQHS